MQYFFLLFRIMSVESCNKICYRKELSEYPTLLHFSAAHGLEQLTCALLDCPGAQAALNIR